MNIKDIIPKDWKIVKLSEITELITKGTTPTTNGYSYLDDGVNFVKVESIHANGTFIPQMFAHVGEDCHNSFKRSQLRNNDILFTIAGALGRSAIVNNQILPANTNQAVAIIRLKNPEYLNYIFHYLRGNYVKNLIEKINVSTAQANLSLGQINQFEIPLPPHPEQQKIAEILSTVDDKIEVIEQQITETQELKKGLMQRLLTKGIGHTEFKDSPLGMIPKSWEVVELDAVCNVIDPHPSHRAPKEDSNGFPFVGIGDINKNGEINLEKSRKISIKDIEKQKETFTLEENDMGFGRVASIGKVVWFKKQEFPYAISPTMALIKAKKVNPLYCYQFLSSSLVTDQFRMLSVGSTRTSIGMKSLRTLKFLLPSKTEQLQISDILLTMDEKLEVLSEKKTNYQELKQGLMQQLLTGKIRVKV